MRPALNSEEAKFTTFEPKRENRFLVRFPEELGIPTWIVKSVSEIVYSPTIGYYPVVFELYDPISPSGTQILSELKDKQIKVIEKIIIQDIGPVGDVVGELVLETCSVERLYFGNRDWNSDDIIILKIEVKPRRGFTVNF